jgi:hypothetical protein
MPTELSLGEIQRDEAVDGSATRHYTISWPATATRIQVTATATEGDVGLFLTSGGIPEIALVENVYQGSFGLKTDQVALGDEVLELTREEAEAEGWSWDEPWTVSIFGFEAATYDLIVEVVEESDTALEPLVFRAADLIGEHGPYMAMNGRERLFITFQNGRSAQIPERAAQGRANNICKLNGRAEATSWLAMPSLSRTEPTLTMVTDTGNLVRNTRGQLEVSSRGRQIGPTKFFTITCGTEPFSAGKRVAQWAAQKFELTPAYPNPFNSEVVIRFALPQDVTASVEIYNVSGQKVRTLARGFLAGGSHRFTWDGLDDAHHRVATGMYLVRLNAGAYRSVQKITLLR